MHGLKGERTLMRIHVEEQDKYKGHPLYQCIVELLRKKHFAGATAYRAVEGFGATSKLHIERAMSLKMDVPVVIECIDSDEKIQSILPELDEMIGGGVITLERVRVIMYRKDIPPHERDEQSALDITGSWEIQE
jgi:PII-like signaling protein